ncbi:MULTISPECIES: biotin/lipoyl-containing protein [unclassified Neptuniibacter]|jgi:pyruvate/2-oxoglutarate dehydrogenase complex dihydrolipoamide acyltransferase (E2) component|uniref:biotin/lipoyl-containing protein n=1 Tax=unclassified Neptuniibacter TaxID=2630693 RepID=UPI0026E35820|nr:MULTISPECIES: biotin/lipoyl-containing protein [unclassified Neptuniibacter]MDO6515178.1 biotin/lipoyl-containing protein [Neptuniibacter sp. 2_MG-2023]MDO6592232.1 biotin/lipoyl-containing protein [Neptuniibacter sp. 1_MG-2023]
MTDVIVPVDLWEEDSEAVITSWLASDGGDVSEGDVIAELMVEKIQYELLAPATGKLSLISDADDVVEKGQKVATIG